MYRPDPPLKKLWVDRWPERTPAGERLLAARAHEDASKRELDAADRRMKEIFEAHGKAVTQLQTAKDPSQRLQTELTNLLKSAEDQLKKARRAHADARTATIAAATAPDLHRNLRWGEYDRQLAALPKEAEYRECLVGRLKIACELRLPDHKEYLLKALADDLVEEGECDEKDAMAQAQDLVARAIGNA